MDRSAPARGDVSYILHLLWTGDEIGPARKSRRNEALWFNSLLAVQCVGRAYEIFSVDSSRELRLFGSESVHQVPTDERGKFLESP